MYAARASRRPLEKELEEETLQHHLNVFQDLHQM
jgi:hypothetical protein